MNRDEEELTFSELVDESEFTGLKADTLQKAAHRGAIPGARVRAGRWFATRKSLREYVKRLEDPAKKGPKVKS